ncbi:MAG: PQQ-binding-like beta-propeller repeat protein, partial [Planctomycetota bacterium]
MTRGPKVVVILIACVLIGGHALADDWPTYRHDHRRSAVSKEVADTSRLVEAWRWKAATPPLAAWPGPARWDAYAGLRGLRAMRNYDPAFHVIAVGDSIYFASNSDDTVRSLNATSGNLNWTFTADGPVRVAPEFVDGKLFFGADDGSAYCIKANDGTLVWRKRPVEPKRWLLNDGRLISTLPVRSGVLVRDDRAYFTASLTPWSESFICCVDAATGESENGFVKSVGNGKTLEGAMLASTDELILPQGRVAPLVFDLANGTSKGALPGGGGSFVLLTEDDHVLHGPGNKQAMI